MMPWDMLMTVNGYWEYKFRNGSLDYLEDDPLADEPALTRLVQQMACYTTT